MSIDPNFEKSHRFKDNPKNDILALVIKACPEVYNKLWNEAIEQAARIAESCNHDGIAKQIREAKK